MKTVLKPETRAVVALGILVPSVVVCAPDVTLSMYMYLANHLTPRECLKLAARLYAEGLGSAAAGELEQDLPLDEPCLSLLTTWNDSAGKEKSFLNVADCLRTIGREKLAEWLSDTVFTHLSVELNKCFLLNGTPETSTSISAVAVSSRSLLNSRFQSKNESCWTDETPLFLLFDTFFTYLILMGIVTLVFYALSLLVDVVKESQNVLSMEHKVEYTILEIGVLPQDLAPDDNILDPLF